MGGGRLVCSRLLRPIERTFLPHSAAHSQQQKRCRGFDSTNNVHIPTRAKFCAIIPRASSKQRTRVTIPCVTATTEAVNNPLTASVGNVPPKVTGSSDVIKQPAAIAGPTGHNCP